MTQATAHTAPGTGPNTPDEEPLAERLWRQVEAGQIDEERLLRSVQKRQRQIEKKLEKPLEENGWRKFVSGQAYAIAAANARCHRSGHRDTCAAPLFCLTARSFPQHR